MLPELERTLQAHADAARTVHAAPTEEERQTLGAHYAVDLVPGCTYAGVLRRHRHRAANAAATDEVARLADAFGNEKGTGPGMEVLDQQISVVSADLGSESRWGPWTHYARETLGIEAAMAVPLDGSSRSFGALTLYFAEPISDPELTLARAETFATHFTLALACSLTIEHQAAALENRTVIGQAQGVLIASSGLTAETAFAYLQRLSQHSNRKLRDIAAEVVSNRGPLLGTAQRSRDDDAASPEGAGRGIASPSSVAAADFTED